MIIHTGLQLLFVRQYLFLAKMHSMVTQSYTQNVWLGKPSRKFTAECIEICFFGSISTFHVIVTKH